MNVKLTMQEMRALRLISEREFSCERLAGALKVSRPTAARIVASLRRKGFRISTRREQGHWSYELMQVRDNSLKSIIGLSGSKAPSNGSMRHDDYLVELHEQKTHKPSKAMKRGA